MTNPCFDRNAHLPREVGSIPYKGDTCNATEPVTRTLFTQIRMRIEEITKESWESHKLLSDLQTSLWGPRPERATDRDVPPKPTCESEIIDYVLSDLRLVVAEIRELASNLRNIA